MFSCLIAELDGEIAMKYKIEPAAEKQKFQPFSLTLTFETKEEYVDFHDNVMKTIVKGAKSHDLYGHLFRAGNGDIADCEGRI